MVVPRKEKPWKVLINMLDVDSQTVLRQLQSKNLLPVIHQWTVLSLKTLLPESQILEK